MYNTNLAVDQICKDLDDVVTLQKKSLEILDRVLYNGEKIFSPEVYPRVKKISIIQNSFTAYCMTLISCGQYSRNLACLGRINIKNLTSFVARQNP